MWISFEDYTAWGLPESKNFNKIARENSGCNLEQVNRSLHFPTYH